jgi:hypothetical protein
MNAFQRRVIALGAIAATTTALLSGCALVPDLAPESLAANKSACESITSVWGSLASVLDPASLTDAGSLESAGEALAGIPAQVQAAIETSTDSSLDGALSDLKKQIDAIAGGEIVDLASVATAGTGLAARCAVFGVTPNLTLPGM